MEIPLRTFYAHAHRNPLARTQSPLSRRSRTHRLRRRHGRLQLAIPGSQFVFGVEVDAAGASIKDSLTADIGGGILATEELKINSFGSVTGRAGFAMDAALIYAKGGFAWANRKDTISVPAFGVSFSDSHSHTGYTLGGGLEYLFTPNWSAKGEYMFTSLGSKTYNLGGDLFDSGTIDFHTIKVGVNYHFR